jgi:hypothetical protein
MFLPKSSSDDSQGSLPVKNGVMITRGVLTTHSDLILRTRHQILPLWYEIFVYLAVDLRIFDDVRCDMQIFCTIEWVISDSGARHHATSDNIDHERSPTVCQSTTDANGGLVYFTWINPSILIVQHICSRLGLKYCELMEISRNGFDRHDTAYAFCHC